MNLDGLSVFQLMGQKMNWLATRQTLISQNVANADTPGYAPVDLKPFNFKAHLELAEALPIARTNSGHLMPGGVSRIPVTTSGEVIETQPDGNAVSIEDQMTKAADTGAEYQMILNLYRKQVGFIKTALGRGGSA